jgi:hypothetical protein
MVDRNAQCHFVMRLRNDGRLKDVYSSPVPMFGRLKMGADSQHCQIEKDEAGWHGSSDVHFCIALPTKALAKGHKTISLNLWRTTGNFRDDYGLELEISSADILDETKLRLVRSISGHTFPTPTPNVASASLDEITDGRVSMTHPHLGVKNQKAIFTTRIALLTESDRKSLSDNWIVTVEQTSPCTVTLTHGSVDHLCQFPYPVNAQGSQFRISRKDGWIDVSVPLTIPKLPDGGFSMSPLPLTRGVDSCSWNLPTINFNQLTRVDTTDRKDLDWLSSLLLHVISDKDGDELDDPNLSLEFKILHAAVFRVFCGFQGRRHQVFGFSFDGKPQILLFVTGLYLDTASHNVVMDAHCCQVTPEFTATLSKLRVDERLRIKDMEMMRPCLIDVWKSALPAMVERCRSWEHKETCEFKADELPWMCSCGLGKVQPDFLQVKEWAEFAPKVVRCALSPLLPEPFIEQTRQQQLARFQSTVAELRRNFEDPHTCAACGSITEKKCGRCEKVYYCKRECQKKHWKAHKKECR